MLSPEILKKLKIDECDMPLFNSHNWSVNRGKYPQTAIRLPNGRRMTKLFHRMILNAPPGVQVDHINGDTWDNRRANLRLCTAQQNNRNRRNNKAATSSTYKGVYWNKRDGKWQAYISVDDKMKNLGLFRDEIAAAQAYDAAAIELFGVFAKPNFT
jgi:hypothetical protein